MSLWSISGLMKAAGEFAEAESWFSLLQNGRVQNYLRVIGVALAALGLFLLWGCQAL